MSYEVKIKQSGTITFPKVKRCTAIEVAEALKAVIRALENTETTDKIKGLIGYTYTRVIDVDTFKERLLENLNVELEKYYVEN